MSTGISHGYRGAAASIAGLQVGLSAHIVLVGIGLGALISQSLLAFELLKWLGAAYLVWLGIQQWRAAGALDLHALAGSMPRRRLFRRAVLVNLTNPKSIVFLAALFPQFILPNQPQAEQYLVLGVTTVVVDILVMIGYATLATRIAGWLRTPRHDAAAQPGIRFAVHFGGGAAGDRPQSLTKAGHRCPAFCHRRSAGKDQV